MLMIRAEVALRKGDIPAAFQLINAQRAFHGLPALSTTMTATKHGARCKESGAPCSGSRPAASGTCAAGMPRTCGSSCRSQAILGSRPGNARSVHPDQRERAAFQSQHSQLSRAGRVDYACGCTNSSCNCGGGVRRRCRTTAHPAGARVELTFSDLRVLDPLHEGTYWAWIVGVLGHAAGAILPDASGRAEVPLPVSDAIAFVVSVEPSDDRDPAISSQRLLGEPFAAGVPSCRWSER